MYASLMNTKNNPFKNGQLEDILKIEKEGFIIQLGNDVYLKNRHFIFDSILVKRYYKNLSNKLVDKINNGSKEQKELALEYLTKLKVYPIRFH